MSKTIRYVINNRHGKAQSVAVWIPGGKPLNIRASHSNFNEVLTELQKPEHDIDKIRALMNKAEEIKAASEQNVQIYNGGVYYKGQKLGGALVDDILDFHHRKLPFKPLLRFLQNLMQNPSQVARDELFKFLQSMKFTFTPDGCFLAYKGVQNDLYSITSRMPNSPAMTVISGKEVNGKIYNGLGEKIRVRIDGQNPNPRGVCNAWGIHVGNYEYANNYGKQGTLVLVKVNPADVSTVPSYEAKCLVFAYEVVEILDNRQALTQRLEPKYLAIDDEDAASYHNKRGANGRFVKQA